MEYLHEQLGMYQYQYLVLNIGIEYWFWLGIDSIGNIGIDKYWVLIVLILMVLVLIDVDGTDSIGIESVGIESIGIGIEVLIYKKFSPVSMPFTTMNTTWTAY